MEHTTHVCCMNYFITEPVRFGFIAAMNMSLAIFVWLGVGCKIVTDVSVKSVHSVFVVEEKAACVKHIGCRGKAEQSCSSDNR